MNDGVVETEQGTPVAPAPGVLAAARNAAGMTLADAARNLKLSPWQVEALESGDYARLPGPVFVRGFIRNYARLLKIDAAPLLAEIASQAAAEQPVEQVAVASESIPFPGQQSFNWRPYAIAGAVIVALLAGYEFFGDDAAPESVDTHAVELPAPQVVAETSAPAAPAENSPPVPVAAAPAPTAVTAPVVPPAQRSEPRVEPAAAPVQPAPATVAPAAAERGPNDQTVRMMFTRESWVEVRDGRGRVVFSQLNAAGTSQAVNAAPPLRLVVGNASGVRLLHNDRLIDLAPFTQVDVARLTLE
jgi:cytoskeleton protein RodZ